MKSPIGSYRPLYSRVRRLRSTLAVVLITLVLATEVLDYIRLHPDNSLEDVAVDVLVYGIIGPVLIWCTLNSLTGWLRQRDEAEARLRVLYQITREIADARDLETLDKIALSIPTLVLGPVGTALIVQDLPNGPWNLVATRNISENQRSALESRMQDTHAHPFCEECQAHSAGSKGRCPLLPAVQAGSKAAPVASLCLPLSRDVPSRSLLSIFLDRGLERSTEEPQMLESLAAGLAVAKDRVRLRGRNMRVLQGVEQAVQTRGTWVTAVEQMLAGIAQSYDAVAGAVFLTGDQAVSARLSLAACWPDEEAALPLMPIAQETLLTENPEIVDAPFRIGHVMAVRLVSEGQPVGVVTLAGRSAFVSIQLTFLRVAASVMAVVIRNGQLYAELDSQAVLEERHRLARDMHDGLAQYLSFLNLKVQQVERQLGREPEAARQALHEVRAGINDLYAEVRVAIQDLRSPGLNERDLAEQLREFLAEFAVRSGLAISFDSNSNPDVSPQAKVHLLRIAEEALTNVHRHAQARQCWVRLQAGPDDATLEIKDDGIGLADAMTPHSPVNFGMRIMQERVQAVGGHFQLHSRPGEGVLLQVTVPSRRRSESVGGGA